MEETTLEERSRVLAHILTVPTTQPSLYDQFFISRQMPCYLKWDYPPVFCKRNNNGWLPLHFQYGLLLFFRRCVKLGLPETSWRCKCPFQQPPPLTIAKGVEPASLQLNTEKKRELARKILNRKRWISRVHPLIPFLVPNVALFMLFFHNPLPEEYRS
ncbi:uncharacterized protein LOC116252155 [Nymphaea colorata]|nr:uncharacterized protein LOC116252155 [Nymphaea colorata]XP_049936199.1 uncharacterized protein LOC116252155 [Nymphaea colorata]